MVRSTPPTGPRIPQQQTPPPSPQPKRDNTVIPPGISLTILETTPTEAKKLENVVPITDEQPKAKSFAGRVMGYVASSAYWLKDKTVENAVWVKDKTLENASWFTVKTAEMALFNQHEIDAAHKEGLEELQEMVGGPEFGNAISRVSSLIAEEVRTKVFDEGVIKSLIETEGQFLQHLIEALLTKAVVNVGKDLQDKQLRDGVYDDKPLKSVDLALHLIDIFKEELEVVQANLESAGEMEDAVKKERTKQGSLIISVENLLDILLPNGANELPLRPGIRGIVWSYLKNSVFPKLLLEAATIQRELQELSKAEALKSDDDTAILGNVVDSTNYLVQRQAAILKDREVADNLASKIMPLLPAQDEASDEALKDWLGQQIQELGDNTNPQVGKFWKIAEQGVEIFLSHALYNLSANRPVGDDAIAAIVDDLGEQVSDFVIEHQEKIAEVAQQLQAEGIDPKTDPSYIECFMPLSDLLMKNVGLQDTEIPEAVRKRLKTIEEKHLPALLAKNYEKVIVPAADLYVEAKYPEEFHDCEDLALLPGGELLSTGSSALVGMVSTKVSEVLAKDHIKLSTTISDKVMNFVPQLDDKVKALLSGKEEAPEVEEKEVPELDEWNKVEIEDSLSWLQPWLDRSLQRIGSSDDPRIMKLFKFLESSADKLIGHGVNAIYDKRRIEGEEDLTVAVLDSLKGVIEKYMEGHGEQLKARYDELREWGSDPKTDKVFLSLLAPVCDDLLGLLDLGESDQVPLPGLLQPLIKKIVMDQVPKILAEQYQQIAQVQEMSKMEALKGDADKQVLTHLIETGNFLLQRQIDQLSDNPEVVEQTIEKIVENVPKPYQALVSDTLKLWSQEKIQELIPLVPGAIEAVLSHVLYSLSRNGNPGDDAIITIGRNLGNVIAKFEEENGPIIGEVYKDLQQQGAIPETSKGYIAWFGPLAKEIMSECGLDDPELPIPEWSKPFLTKLEKDILPKLLAKNYKALAEAAELYSAVTVPVETHASEDLAELPGGKLLSQGGVELAKMVSGKVPEYLASKHEELSSKLSEKVANIAPKIEGLINTAITGKPAEIEGESEDFTEALAWLKPWLDANIAKAGTTKDPRMANVWKFLGSSVDKLVGHAAMSVHAQTVGEENDVTVEVLNGIKNVLASYMEDHGVEVQTRYSELRKEGIDPKEDKEFQALFTPLCDGALRLLGLDGSEELPMPLLLQPLIKKTVMEQVPAILAENYQKLVDMQSMSKMEPLRQDPDKQVLANVIDSANYILMREVENLSDPAIVENIADQIVAKVPSQTAESAVALKAWTAEQIQEFIKVGGFLVPGAVETVLSHVLYNFSAHGEAGDDALMTIVHNFGKLVSNFEEINHTNIVTMRRLLENENVVPESDPRYVALFKPLAEMIILGFGLDDPDLPIHPLAKAAIEKVKDQYLPAFLAKNYSLLIKQIAELYQAVTEPVETVASKELENLGGGDFISKVGVQVKGLVDEKVPAFLAEEHEALALDIFKIITGQLPRLDNAVRAKVVGEQIGPQLPSEVTILEGYANVDKEIEATDALGWLIPWLDSNIEIVGKSKDPRLVNVWKFLASRTDELFAHGIRSIYKKSTPTTSIKRDVSTEAINTLMDMIGKFMESNGAAVQARYAEICEQAIEPRDDKEFVALLAPLFEELYELLGFNNTEKLPVPEILKPKLKEIAIEQMSKWMAGEYRKGLVPRECIATCKQELEEIFTATGSTKAAEEVDQIEHLTNLLAGKLTTTFDDLIQKELMKQFVEAKSALTQPPIQRFKDTYVNEVIKSILLQMTVNFVRGIKADGSPRGGMVAEVLARMGTVMNKHLTADAEVVKAAQAETDPVVRKAKLVEAFRPVSDELLELFRAPEGWDTDAIPVIVPLPSVMGGFWKPVKEDLLPGFLAGLYEDKLSWPQLQEANKAEILKRTEGSHIPEACRILATYVGEFLPPFLFRERVNLSETLMKAATKYLAESGNPDGLSVEAYIKANEQEIKERLCSDVFGFVAPDGPLIETGKPMTQEYLEFVLMKLFNGVASTIAEKEDAAKGEKEFLVKVCINLMSVANKHFKTINRAAGTQYAFEVKHQTHVKALQAKANAVDGVLQDDVSIRAEGDIRNCIKAINEQLEQYDKVGSPQEKINCIKTVKVALDNLKAARKEEQEQRRKFFKDPQNLFSRFLYHEYFSTSNFESKEAKEADKELENSLKRIEKKVENFAFSTNTKEGDKYVKAMKVSMAKFNQAKKIEDNERKTFFSEKAMLQEGMPGSPEAMQAFDRIGEALEAIDKAREQYGKSKTQADKDRCMTRIKEAQQKLKAAKEVEEKERRAFFEPLTAALLDIAGISKVEDLPFPEPLRSQVYDLAKSQLLPNVLSSIFSTILEPSTINTMMKSGVDHLNAALEASPDLEADKVEASEVPKDDTQRLLNKVCGELILELLRQVPESYIRVALKFDYVKKFTTEGIGEAVRRYLGESLTLGQIVEMGVEAGMPSLHPGKWQVEDGKKVFVGESQVPGATKGPLKFSFPITDDQVEAEARANRERVKKEEAIMKQEMVKTVHRLASDALVAYGAGPYVWLLETWNKAVDKVFGRQAVKVRDFFKYDGEKVGFRLIETASLFIYNIVTFLPWLLFDWHNSRKIDRLVQGMHMRIHENLLMGLTNELVAALRSEGPIDYDNIIRPIIEAANERDRIAEEKRQEYLRKWGLIEGEEQDIPHDASDEPTVIDDGTTEQPGQENMGTV